MVVLAIVIVIGATAFIALARVIYLVAVSMVASRFKRRRRKDDLSRDLRLIDLLAGALPRLHDCVRCLNWLEWPEWPRWARGRLAEHGLEWSAPIRRLGFRSDQPDEGR